MVKYILYDNGELHGKKINVKKSNVSIFDNETNQITGIYKLSASNIIVRYCNRVLREQDFVSVRVKTLQKPCGNKKGLQT